MNQSQLIEFRMGRKVLASIENLVKNMRSPGPFGGFQSEAISIKNILKRSEEEVHIQETCSKKKPTFVNTSKSIKVYLEDKYMKKNRTLVEQYIVETLEIPDNLNGFEYLFHPHLDKPEVLQRFFNHWLSTTLNSLFYLLEGVALSRYFLCPGSDEELEVANELRKRYNLTIETDEFDLRDGVEAGKPEKSLESLYKTRHYVHKLLIKKRIYILKNYKEIIQEIRQVRLSPISKIAIHHGSPYISEHLLHMESRKRFFSANNIGTITDNFNQISRPNETPKGVNESTERARVSSEELSLDLSASSSLSNRPFKLQESLIEERVLQHKRKISVDSLTMLKRTGISRCYLDSQAVALAEEMGQIDYALSQKGEDTKDTNSRITGEEDSSGTLKKTIKPKANHRKSSTMGNQFGLASIGSQLLKSGTITDDCLELDEDDRLMELCDTLEKTRSNILLVPKTNIPREEPQANTGFMATRVVFNLADPKNLSIENFNCMEAWLNEIKKFSTNIN